MYGVISSKCATYIVRDVISESRSSECFVMATGGVDGSTCACFCYEHFSYIFFIFIQASLASQTAFSSFILGLPIQI